MFHVMIKPRKLKLRRYIDFLIDINAYFDAFIGSKASDNIGEMEFNKTILNSIPK